MSEVTGRWRSLMVMVMTLQCFLSSVMVSTNAFEFAPSFWDFEMKDIAGNQVKMSQFQESKAILIVNVASSCGYTDQNYKELQTMYQKYHSKGLEILAFPCNQFGAQEQNDDPAIAQFVQDQYHVTFPLMAKVDVNGDDMHPLFEYLKAKLAGLLNNDIKWNFTKFLVVDGIPTKRYSPTTSPFQTEKDILKALGLEHSEL